MATHGISRRRRVEGCCPQDAREGTPSYGLQLRHSSNKRLSEMGWITTENPTIERTSVDPAHAIRLAGGPACELETKRLLPAPSTSSLADPSRHRLPHH